MTEMHWKKVESIFHEALSLYGELREKFLDKACQGDATLRSEVDSLLANYHEGDEFLEKGALPHDAVSEPIGPTFNAGVVLGHYEIIRLLGAGGMGEVYLARDQRLGRKVALKILPAGFAGNMERLKREAQAASALNHPNILTIYDFGQQSELRYIVSEFVDGVQLRQQIGNLSISEALNYARQIGHALEAAHSVGIVHRDIKPENIMVRPDGYIKVLDFGLAKLVTPQSESDHSLYQRLAGSVAASIPGMLMGTLNYMSPEQVKGQPADLRTDIWSWGVVLFEMLYSHRPFEAPTPQEVMASILHKAPEAPGERAELNPMVLRSLSKQPEQRYQSMAEALAELEQFRTPELRRDFSRWWNSIPLGWFKRILKRPAWIILIGSLLILGGVVAYVLHRNVAKQSPYSSNSASQADTPQNPQMRVEQITYRTKVTHAALAPDEDYVVYSEEGNAGEALRIHYFTDRPEEEIAHTSKGSYKGITLAKSKEEDVIYYVEAVGERGKLYRLPLGGRPRQLILDLDDDIDSPISFSPDRSHFVFVRINPKTKVASLVIRAQEDGSEIPLTILKPPEFIYKSPLWSIGDSPFVLFGSYGYSTKMRSVSIQGTELAEKALDSFWWQGHPAWIENGRSLVVAAKRYSANSQLYKVSWPQGDISEVHPDQMDYSDVDSRPGSKKMIAIQSNKTSTAIWVGRVSDKLTQVKDKNGKYSSIAWTPEGNLVSETDVPTDSGLQPDLVTIDPYNAAYNHRQTYDICLEKDPVVSPDGRYLVYASATYDGVSHRCAGTFHLWRKDLKDRNSFPKRITSGDDPEYQPVISPDSKTVIYTSVTDGSEHLWKTSIDRDERTLLTSVTAKKADISPDGKRVSCRYLATLEEGWSTAILSMRDGHRINSLPDIPSETTARWSANGERLFYVEDKKGVSNIWWRPVHGGTPTQLTQFKDEQIFAFALSPDRHRLACLRGRKSSDVVLLQPAK